MIHNESQTNDERSENLAYYQKTKQSMINNHMTNVVESAYNNALDNDGVKY